MTSFNLLCTVTHNCHGKTKNLTAKTKYLTTKPKTSRQKQNTSRQNQNSHGKTKDLTAKPNTSQQKPNISRQKQIPMTKPKLFWFCCEVFGFNLPWGFWFCREVFCFCHEVFGFRFCCDVFGFAVTFSVLPWQLWATIALPWTIRRNIASLDYQNAVRKSLTPLAIFSQSNFTFRFHRWSKPRPSYIWQPLSINVLHGISTRPIVCIKKLLTNNFPSLFEIHEVGKEFDEQWCVIKSRSLKQNKDEKICKFVASWVRTVYLV